MHIVLHSKKLKPYNFFHCYHCIRPHLDHVRAIFDHISITTKVEGVVESFDDKINTTFMNLECVLPEKEKGIDK